jgi:hypothetical protein
MRHTAAPRGVDATGALVARSDHGICRICLRQFVALNGRSIVEQGHVVLSYDLRTLWVTNNAERTGEGSLIPIDPRTGKPARRYSVGHIGNLRQAAPTARCGLRATICRTQ